MDRILVVGINKQGAITITRNGSTPSADDGEEETTHRKYGDRFQWKVDSTVKQFRLDFTNSPFQTGAKTLTGDSNAPSPLQLICSDANKCPAGKYKYKVTVVPASGNTPTPLDPHIIIDEGGMDPLDHLAAAQFTGAAAVKAVADALAQHMNDVTADGKRFFFPFGIQSISVDVKVNLIEVNIQVSGNTAD